MIDGSSRVGYLGSNGSKIHCSLVGGLNRIAGVQLSGGPSRISTLRVQVLTVEA